ncbi:MAG: DUF2029 domain-containing protein [Chloroflexi bacterium]|nr:DUF2029 domain-containing protein [Chloroflexota bacterium]
MVAAGAVVERTAGWATARWQRLRAPLLIGLVVGVVAGGLAAAWRSGDWQYDLTAFLASGAALNAGQNPYGPAAWVMPRATGDALPNMNPPLWLPLFGAAAALDPALVTAAWFGLSLALVLAALALLTRAYPAAATRARLAWVICLGGLWHTLLLGQIYTVLLLLAVGVWLLLRGGRPVAAGLLLGVLVALKPNFVIWPLLLLLAGQARPALWAGTSAGLLSLLPALWYGPAIYGQWLAVVQQMAGFDVPARNAALPGLIARLGWPALGLPLTAVLLAALAGWVAWRRPDREATSELGLTATLIAGPLTWPGYTLLLLPLFWRRAHWPPALAAIALLLTYPAMSLVTGLQTWGIAAGAVYAVVLVALLVSLVARGRVGQWAGG